MGFTGWSIDTVVGLGHNGLMARKRRRNPNTPRNTNLYLLPPLESRTPLRQLLDEDGFLADAARDLTLCVGGIDQLESLDTSPLPVTCFFWNEIPDGQKILVMDILDEIEIAGIEFFGPEAQTIMFRLLVQAAKNPLQPLVRRTTPQRLAAALAWVMLAGNQQFSRHYGRTAKALWERFKVTSCTDLGQAIARDLGMWTNDMSAVTNAPPGTVFLGDPGLLFAKVRRSLIDIGAEIETEFQFQLESREASKPLVVTPDGGLEARAVRVGVANAFVGDSERGCQIVVGFTYDDDELEMMSLSIDDAERLVACVTSAIAESGLAS